MEVKATLLVVQLLCLAGVVISGVLGNRWENLDNPWYMRVMWTFCILSWVIMLLILVL